MKDFTFIFIDSIEVWNFEWIVSIVQTFTPWLSVLDVFTKAENFAISITSNFSFESFESVSVDSLRARYVLCIKTEAKSYTYSNYE
jgi:hypothetical protein